MARLGSQTWAKLLSFALAPLIVRFAGAAVLGRYLMALTVSSIVAAAADLGLTLYLTREAAQHSDCADQRRLLGDILMLKLLSVVLFAGLLALVAPLLPLSAATRSLLPIAALALVPEAVAAALHAVLNARQRMDLSSGLVALTRLIVTLGALVAVASGGGAAAVLWWQVVAGTAGAVTSLVVLWHTIGPPTVDPARLLCSRAVATYIADALPFAATGFIAIVYRRLDLLILGTCYSELLAGWYGAATRLWEAVHLLPASLLDALFPELSRIAALPDGRSQLRRLVRLGGAASLGFGIGLAAIGALVGPVGLRLIYGSNVARATLDSWWILLGALPAVSLYLLGGHVLYALGEQRAVTARMFITAVLSAGANFALIPLWRHIGAAIALVLTEWLLSLLLYGRAWRDVRAERWLKRTV